MILIYTSEHKEPYHIPYLFPDLVHSSWALYVPKTLID